VSLFPELRPYTIFIDGISKSFCATGVRVGWAFGPEIIIDKMKGILSHIGAWSPMAEQVATANFLNKETEVDHFLSTVKLAIHDRLQQLFDGIQQMKQEGYPVDAISPMAAIYLTIRFSFKGKMNGNQEIKTTADMTSFLLEHASLAIVPFAAFGADKESEWYRLSVGTCHLDTIPQMFSNLRKALDKLT
jgi:aspartate aminotransferase